MNIETISDLKKALRNGQYAWPGGYPCYFIAEDGAALSFDAVRENIRNCFRAIKNNESNGWRVVSVDINYEDAQLYCAHNNTRIESAYAEDDDMNALPEDAELLFDSSSGIYIPQRFAQEIRRDCVEGVTDWQWKQIENPANDFYWDAWDSILNNAVLIENGKRFTLYQDGDVWLIPS